MSEREDHNHEPRPATPAPLGVGPGAARVRHSDVNDLLALGLVDPDRVLAGSELRRHLAAGVVLPRDDAVAYLGFASLLGHASTPAWLVERVDVEGDIGLTLAALQGPHASPERCRALYEELRSCHPDLATVDLGSAAPVDEGDALAALAVHPRTPSDVLDGIVQMAPPRFVALVVGAAAGVPDILLSAWRRLHDAHDAHPDPWLRVKRVLASHRETPAWLLRSLAGDDDPRARAAAAARPGLSPSLVRTLHEDGDRWVLDALAGNTTLPAARLRRFAWSHDPLDRRAVAANPSLVEEDQIELARDGDSMVRVAVTRNDWLALGIAERLREDDVVDVREAIALNPRRPFDVVAPLAADPSWRVRAAVAVHPGAPHALVQQLLDAGGPRATLRLARGWMDNATPALGAIVDHGFPELWSEMIERCDHTESTRARALAHLLACDPAVTSGDAIVPSVRTRLEIVYRYRGVASAFGERARCAWRFTVDDLRRRLLGVPSP